MPGSVVDGSLRTTVFQRYTQLQMWLLSRIVWYAAALYIGSLVLFALLRLCTGISVKRIGYFSLRHITVTPKQGVQIRIGKLGLAAHRPTVARPGLFTFVISNLEIVIDPEEVIKHEPAPDSWQPSPEFDKLKESVDENANEPPVEIRLVPKSHERLSRFLRWAIPKLSVFNVQLQSTSVVFGNIVTVISTGMNLRLDVRKTRNAKQSNFVGTIDSYKLGENELPLEIKLSVADIYSAESIEDESPWKVLEDTKFDVSGVLSLDELRVRELGIQIATGRLELDVHNLHEMLAKVKRIRQKKFPANESSGHSKARVLSAQDKERMVRGALVLLHLVNHVQFTIGIVGLLHIPVVRSAIESDNAFFAATMNDLNLDLSRINPQSSGFKLFYEEGDVAHQAVFTVASLSSGVDTGSEQRELLYVPLLTSLSRGNIFSRTLRFVQKDLKKNESLVRSRWSLHSPTVSIDLKQVEFLVRCVLGLASESSEKGLRDPSPPPDDSTDPTEKEKPKKLDLFLQNSLPNLDFDLVITDPAMRLVFDETATCSDAMFISGCSRVNMQVQSKHQLDTGSYSVNAQFDTAENQIWYRSSSVPRFDISHSESTTFVVRAHMKPHLQMDIEGRQVGFHISALQHEVFHTIGRLVSQVRDPIAKWRKAHPKPPPRDDEDDTPNSSYGPNGLYKPGPLRKIPTFVTRAAFYAEKSSFSVASDRFRGETNDLLGIKLISDNIDITYESGLHDWIIESPTDGRRVRVSGTGIALYKMDKLFLDHAYDDPAAKQRNLVLLMPQLTAEAITLSAFMTLIDIKIEPRLRIDLNINLILAWSVVREIMDTAMMRKPRSKKRAKESDESDDDPTEEKFATPPPDGHPEDANPSSAHPQKRRVYQESISLDMHLPRALIKVDMPSDDQVMIELLKARVTLDHVSNPVLEAKALRMYSEHPFQRGAWCILLSLVNLNAEMNVLHAHPDQPKINLNLDGLRFNMPYKFKLYRIIDNGITLGKAVKTLMMQTKSHDTSLIINPKKIEGVPNVPRTRILAKQFVISLEDDYFESDLGLCMSTMLIASETRRRKLYLFDRKVKSMLRKGLEDIAKADLQSRAQTPHHTNTFSFGHSHHNSTGNATDDSRSPNSHPGDEQQSGSESPNSRHGAHATQFADAANDVVNHMANVFDHHDGSGHEERHNGGLKVSMKEGVARSLEQVPKHKIEILLAAGMELGILPADHDPVMKDHPWLEFWSSATFAAFRKQLVPLENGEKGMLTIDETREALLWDFSRMWVDTINRERMTQHLGAKMKREAIVQDNLDPETCKEETVVDYSQKPMLMTADFRQIDLTIAKTEHGTSESLHRFLHEIGKGLPLNTDFSILVPLFLDLKAAGGVRIDVKDYPLPILHFPPLARNQDPKKNLAFRLSGNLIVTEQLVPTKSTVRKIFVPLKPLPRELRHKAGSDVIEVHRTLTPIKTFTNLKIRIESSLPTRVAWCWAYKPGFHNVGEAFSGFSKPPIDPSPALGFWDKIRLVFHARFDFDFPKSTLALQMKAGKSPYSLLDDDSGFMFAWSKNTHVAINADDNPRELMLFESDCFELLAPNYTSWENEFLHASPAGRAFPRKTQYEDMDPPEKVVFSFNQHTKWTLGMMFEKPSENIMVRDGAYKLMGRDSNFRPHYDVRLSTPEFIKDVESYDAYRGFRSDYIYMAISVVSRPGASGPDLGTGEGNYSTTANPAESRNAAHITPGVLQHFSAWKAQFRSEQWPPIKTGSLFPDPVRVRPSNKTFGTALSTAQYQIALYPLDLSFFHKISHHRASNHERRTGVKAKMEHFVFDWHTRREPPSETELFGARRWRMKSHLGEVDLRAVDIRVIDAKFRRQSATNALKGLHADDGDESDYSDDDSDSMTASSTEGSSTYEKSSSAPTTAGTTYGPRYVGHNYWIDLDDYTEVGEQRRRHTGSRPSVKVHPFMFTPQFCVLRRTDNSGRAVYVDDKKHVVFPKFGHILVHQCMMSPEQPSRLQAGLLSQRQQELRERIGEFKDSLESLTQANGGSLTDALRKRTSELRELINIGEFNDKVLTDEIRRQYGIAEDDDKKLAQLQEKMRLDSKEWSSNVEAPPREDPEWAAAFNASPDDDPDDDVSVFRNRFIFHNVHLKWNNPVRNLIFRLHTALSEDKELQYVRCRPAVQYLEELVIKAEKLQDEIHEPIMRFGSPPRSPSREDERPLPRNGIQIKEGWYEDEGHARLKTMFSDLMKVGDNQYAERSFSVVLLSPRIQLIAENNPAKCLQVTARDIEVQIVDTYLKTESMDLESAKVERRHAAKLNQSSFFIISQSDVKQSGVQALCLESYSGEEMDSKSSWPPWMALELCYNPLPLRNFIIIEDVSFGIRFDDPNDLHVSESRAAETKGSISNINQQTAETAAAFSPHQSEADQAEASSSRGRDGKPSTTDMWEALGKHGESRTKMMLASLVVDTPTLFVNADAEQFYTLYTIATDLLTYQDPLIKKREKAINRVFLSNDFTDDYRASLQHIELLQKDIRTIRSLHQQLQILSLYEADPSVEMQVHMLKLEREGLRESLQLMVLIRAFKASLRSSMLVDTEKLTKWSLLADAIVVRVLSDVGKPFAEFYLKRVHYSKVSNSDAGSLNRVSLGGVYARNMMDNPVYERVIANYEDKPASQNKKPEEVVKVEWSELDPVGGIPVLDDVRVVIKPLHIQLEQSLADRLLDFAFPIRQSKNKHEDNKADDSDSDFDSDDEGSAVYSDVENELSNVPSSRKSGKAQKKGLFGRLVNGSKGHDNIEVDDMINRASNYMSIRSLLVEPTKLIVSYKGRAQYNLLDLQDLVIPLPQIKYNNKTWTKLDLVMRLKREIIKILLGQSGSIIGNRFRRHKEYSALNEKDVGLTKLISGDDLDRRLLREATRRESVSAVTADGHLARAIEEDKANLLLPWHRMDALEKDKDKEYHHGHHGIRSLTAERDSKPASTTESRNSFQGKRLSSFNNYNSQDVRDAPGSPSQLRRPHKSSTFAGFSFGKKNKAKADPTTDGVASSARQPSPHGGQQQRSPLAREHDSPRHAPEPQKQNGTKNGHGSRPRSPQHERERELEDNQSVLSRKSTNIIAKLKHSLQ